MRVLVIGGGNSPEREVSLKSSTAVYESVKKSGIEVDFYDWNGVKKSLQSNLREYDAVLPILHGVGGEDGTIQKILESSKVAYLGSDSLASKSCFDKSKLKEIMKNHNINTPVSAIVDIKSYPLHSLFSRPHVLKPYDGGSSLDTFIFTKKPDALSYDVSKAFSVHKTLLLEEYINGAEITVPILDSVELPVIEIIPSENDSFNYKNKYNGKTKELMKPLSITPEQQNKARYIAKKLHSIAGCRHLSRTDMIISNNKFYVLELNTMPGMTNQSLFPKAAAYACLEFNELVKYFIKLTQESV